MKRLLCAALLVAAATLPFVGVGCGPKMTKVECKVTLDGQPVEGATVTFVPEDKEGLTASGLTDANGVCVMRTGSDKESVRAGKYKITGVTPEKIIVEAAISYKPKQKMLTVSANTTINLALTKI